MPELTPEKVDEVVAVLAEGGSRRQAARTVGCSHQAIGKLLERDPEVRARVKTEQSRLRANERSRSKRSRAKIREVNDPGITSADRPELAPPPPPGTEERMWYDAAIAGTTASLRRAAESNQESSPRLEDLPGYHATPKRRRKGNGGGRVVSVPGHNVFANVVETMYGRPSRPRTGVLGPWEPASDADLADYLDERDRLVTVKVGSTTFRIDPRSEEYADYVAAGCAPPLPE